MDIDESPPDPGPESVRAAIRTALEKAKNSPDFRRDLRECKEIIPYMSKSTVGDILRKCGAQSTEFRNAEQARERLLEYLKSTEDSEAKQRRSNSTGHKRNPSDESWHTQDSPRRRNATSWADMMEENGHNEPIYSKPENQDPISIALKEIVNAIGDSQSALSEAIGLLQLVADGTDPDGRRVREGLNRIRNHYYTLKGMKKALEVSVALAEGNTEDSTENRKLGYTRRTYASVAKNDHFGSSSNQHPEWSVHKSKVNIKRKIAARRAEIAKERTAIRCDERSIRLRPTEIRGAVNGGTLARRLLKLMGTKESEKQVVEDIRTDRSGNYYVQIFKGKAREMIEGFAAKADEEGTVFLSDLGHWKISPPMKSHTAGKTPVVIHGVPTNVNLNQAMDELWLSNKGRWGLNEDADIADHLACPNRLNRKVRSSTSHVMISRANEMGEEQQFEWLPSKSVKVYVSKEVLTKLTEREGLTYVMFDYNRLRVSEYNEPQKPCLNCGRLGHSVHQCRSQARCAICERQHMTSKCPMRLSVEPNKHLSKSGARPSTPTSSPRQHSLAPHSSTHVHFGRMPRGGHE